MSVMDPRPWSPASPHIGPDDEDLAMLDPTGDPEVDLGSVVLAAHRVGAAAAEAVARAPLPDEFRLVDALATARGAFASPAVEAVSKCVGSENPRGYADLLLRDLFDAGEEGALAVYRACVSKGVAPPLAAQRAGLVYGVPHNELGRYLAVATDPKSHPVALADAADRAVTYWASGVVRSEMAEPVSKATQETVDEYNATHYGHQHPKDAEGRFVDVMERRGAPVATPMTGEVAGRPAGFLARLRRDAGYGGQAAPEVAGAPVVTAPVTTVPAPRVVRTQRTQRVQRTQGSTPAVATVKAKIRAALKGGVTASLDARTEARMNAQRNAPTGEGPITEVSFDPDSVGEAFGTIPNIPLAWAMPVNRAQEVYDSLRGAGEPNAPKFTQIGNLQAQFAEPTRWEHRDHEDALESIADTVAGDELPYAIKITERELEEAGISQVGSPEEVAARVKRYAEMAGLKAQLAREEGGALNPIAQGQIGVTPSADKGRDWFVIRKVEAQVHGDPNPPMPMAAEFVVVGDNVRGNIEGGPDARQPYYELDPSQNMVIHSRKTLWRATSEHTGFFIDRYTVEPMDEWREEAQSGEFGMRWVGKAEAPVRTQEAWRTEPRDARGEWIRGGFLARLKPELAEPAEVVQPVVTPIRIQRAQRKQRVQPISTPVKTGVKAQAKANVIAPLPAVLDAKLRAAFAVKEAEAPPKSTGFPVTLDDRPIHRLLTSEQWAAFLKRYAPTSYADDVKGIDLPGPARLAFAEGVGMLRPLDGDQVNKSLRSNVMRMIDEDPENKLVEIASLRRTIGPNDTEAMDHLTVEILDYMETHPDVAHVQIGRNSEGGPWDLTVHRNLRPVKDQTLIYTEDDIDWDRDVSLVWVGKARRDDLNRGREYYYDRGNVVDAPVSVYRAEQRTWRAHQDER